MLDTKGFLGTQINEFIAGYRTQFRRLFELAEEANVASHNAFVRINAHNRDVQEMIVAALYLRILSNYQGAILLAERGMVSEARVLARAQMEALFTLKAVAKDHSLALEYAKEDQKKRIKVLNKLKKLHGGMPPTFDEDKANQLERELLEEIARDKIVERTTEQWAKEAGLHDWYLSAYADLSDTVHTKVRDLSQYLVQDQHENITEFDWGPSDKGLALVIVTVIETQLVALMTTMEFFDRQQARSTEEMRKRLHDIAREYIHE